jgi:hypothetical protein
VKNGGCAYACKSGYSRARADLEKALQIDPDFTGREMFWKC